MSITTNTWRKQVGLKQETGILISKFSNMSEDNKDFRIRVC